jgi:hypothetical protein
MPKCCGSGKNPPADLTCGVASTRCVNPPTKADNSRRVRDGPSWWIPGSRVTVGHRCRRVSGDDASRAQGPPFDIRGEPPRPGAKSSRWGRRSRVCPRSQSEAGTATATYSGRPTDRADGASPVTIWGPEDRNHAERRAIPVSDDSRSRAVPPLSVTCGHFDGHEARGAKALWKARSGAPVPPLRSGCYGLCACSRVRSARGAIA